MEESVQTTLTKGLRARILPSIDLIFKTRGVASLPCAPVIFISQPCPYLVSYTSPSQSYVSKRKISKAIDASIATFKGVKNAASKFSATKAEGSRILPSPTKDANSQLRIDAGHFDQKTNLLNVALQVNSQAKSPALVDWVKKNSTHSNLATATFDTKAQDKTAELNRMYEELKQKAKANIK